MTQLEGIREPEADGGSTLCRGDDGAERRHLLFARVGGRLAELVQISTGQAAERTFDAMLCPMPGNHVTEWEPRVEPGQWVAFALYGTLAFEPLLSLYVAQARRHGVELPPGASPPPGISDAERARSLLWHMGLREIRIYAEQLGYGLDSATEWWDIVSKSVLGRAAAQLPVALLEQLKAEHLVEVTALAKDGPLWVQVPTFFAIGCRP